ncbi:hypothetical protein [Pontibacter mangrovi]|uniref:Uncharacterized protein n=1 Tax=Pontibacter mangrovi TaxID=2589816 RepID=A0A501W2V3_9BACT|nr:hypothetical protein [Pontibacter mangrovi]TPE44243.1 hypothetical protein FJM65_08765 [Pontibacter mangrovi]
MSRHFNLRRFGLLFKKQVAEQYKPYLMSLAVLTGLLALLIGVPAYVQSRPLVVSMQEFLFVMPLLLAGAIFTSSIFSALGDKKHAIATLTLPASHLEKYLLGWVFSFLIFLILYTISFYGVLAVVLSMDDWQGAEKQMLNIFSGRMLRNVLGAYAMVHAVALVGAVYFEKGHFIKTAFVFLLFMIVLVTLNKQVIQLVLGHDLSAMPFGGVTLTENDRMFNVAPPKQFSEWLNSALGVVLMLILWIAAYARLREKQV